MKTISRKQWINTHSDYKSISGGQRKILIMTDKGTTLVPVHVKGMRPLRKKRMS